VSTALVPAAAPPEPTARPSSTALPVSPAAEPRRGIYLHVPFCLVHCPYCDFNAHAGMDDVKPAYVEALLAEIAAAGDGGRVDTIAFGGGTPTELPTRDLGRILAAVRDGFSVVPGAEIGLEANPESVGRACFDALLDEGFTRVSLGVQSLSAPVLSWLGRAHSPQQALRVLGEAVAAGFPHVNADLMFGTPGETAEDWRASLLGVLGTGIDHVSTYALTVEERTPLAAWVARGRRAAPDDDEQADRYEAAAGILTAAGLVRYELSNWSRPGGWSRHNVGYWTGGSYLGFGAGAHSLAASRDGSRRWWNVASPRSYIARSPAVEDGFEVLPAGERAAEAAMLGLRLAGGIDRAAFARRWGPDPAERWASELASAEELGLAAVTPERVQLTDRGFFLWGHVARSLLG
jgi:putative oxygen-independent coproporphyrinogen III oxidase